MRIHILPATALLLLPSLGFASDPMTPIPLPTQSAPASGGAESPSEGKTVQGLNQEVRAVTAAFESTRQCFDLESSLKADVARKKASLAAEFNGKIPPAFNDLLWKKTQRVSKQHAECFRQYDELGRMFAAIHVSFRAIEPKSQNVKKQKDSVDALKERFLLMLPTARPRGKAAQPKPTAE